VWLLQSRTTQITSSTRNKIVPNIAGENTANQGQSILSTYFEGFSGTDSDGDFIVLPPEYRNLVKTSDLVTDENGVSRFVREDDYVIVNGARFLKLYLQ